MSKQGDSAHVDGAQGDRARHNGALERVDCPPEQAGVTGHEVRITVLEVLRGGEPPCGYRAGDSWTVTDLRAPQGMCTWALSAMAPFLATLRFGGALPWENDRDRTTVCCPDPANPVVFELRRVR